MIGPDRRASGRGHGAPLLAVENLKKHFPIYTGVFSRVAG